MNNTYYFYSYICVKITLKRNTMIDVKETLNEAEERFEETVMYLEDALARIRAGKANIKILDPIRVDSYGSMVPLNNVAAVNTPDARTIAIKPWDKSMFRIIDTGSRNTYQLIFCARYCRTSFPSYSAT